MKKLWSSLAILFLFAFFGCSSSKSNATTPTPDDTNTAPQTIVAAVGGDFANPLGLIYGIQNSDPLSISLFTDQADKAINTYQDSIVRSYKNKIYVLGRDSNSAVLVFEKSQTKTDPIANYSLSELDPDQQYDIDGGFNGTNPYDIVFKSESEAYVCFYNSNYLLKINPLTGKRLNRIDVSFIKTIAGATASDATAPFVCDLELIGDQLFILTQRFNAFYTPLEAAMVIYNIQTEKFIDTNPATEDIDGVILAGKNPSNMVYDASSKKLLIAHQGNVTYKVDFSAIESSEVGSTGIESFDTVNHTTSGIVIPGTAFGGTTGGFSISKILYDQQHQAYLAVYNTFDFTSNIKHIDLTAKTASTEALLPQDSFSFGDTVIDQAGHLFQINRDQTNPSIDVYSIQDHTLLKSLATDLPMQSITLIE